MANVPTNRRWWPKLAEAAVHPAVEQAFRQAYNAIYDSQDAITALNDKHNTTNTTITQSTTIKREDYAGTGWAVTWIVFGTNLCLGSGYCIEGSVITLATGFPASNMVWSGSVRTIWAYLNPGDALIGLDFLIPNGGNTCTLCRSMKSTDLDTWRTTNITGEFIGLGYQ
jgi:hypothetical protein